MTAGGVSVLRSASTPAAWRRATVPLAAFMLAAFGIATAVDIPELGPSGYAAAGLVTALALVLGTPALLWLLAPRTSTGERVLADSPTGALIAVGAVALLVAFTVSAIRAANASLNDLAIAAGAGAMVVLVATPSVMRLYTTHARSAGDWLGAGAGGVALAAIGVLAFAVLAWRAWTHDVWHISLLAVLGLAIMVIGSLRLRHQLARAKPEDP